MVYCRKNKEAILSKVQYLKFWTRIKCSFFFPTAVKRIWLCKRYKNKR